MAPVVVPLRPSNEVMDAPSELARFLFREGVLLDLPLRASNEGLLRPRVARAQEINRPPSRSLSQRPERPFEELLGEGHMLLDV
jgi:hypothetical protein